MFNAKEARNITNIALVTDKNGLAISYLLKYIESRANEGKDFFYPESLTDNERYKLESLGFKCHWENMHGIDRWEITW